MTQGEAEATVNVVQRWRVVYTAVLLGLMLALVVTAYYPFNWDPPRVVRNDVTRTANGSLHFGVLNRARTTGTPDWVAAARASGLADIRLVVDPQSSQQHSPASMMMLARDYWHTDFAIAQEHSRLLVWVRRPGSDGNGNPPFVVNGALSAEHWNRIEVRLLRDRIQIRVNGVDRLSDRLPADALRSWGSGQIALGDEVHGGGPWQGRIRKAEVVTGGQAVDYVHPGSLSIPVHYLYLTDHVAPFPPLGRAEWIAFLLHWLSFIVVGFLIVSARRPRIRPVPAILLAVTFAVVLAAGKFFFHGRHTGAGDLIAQTLGAVMGVFLAWQQSERDADERTSRLS